MKKSILILVFTSVIAMVFVVFAYMAIPMIAFDSYEIKESNCTYEVMRDKLNPVSRYKIPLAEMVGGSNYYFIFQKGMDHYFVVRYKVTSEKFEEIKSNKSRKWSKESKGISDFGIDWYYKEGKDDLLFYNVDRYNYWVLDLKSNFVYFVQFST